MNPVSVRRAVSSDFDIVYGFLCRLSEKQHDRGIIEAYYLTNISNEDIIYLVAEIDNRVVGFLSCHGQLLLHHAGWAYEIQEMFTDEAYRSLGIGKLLLEELELILDKTSYDILEVTSNNRRNEAHHFYLVNGFVQTHQKFTKKGNA